MELFMKKEDLIVSKTDLKGHIVYGNEHFIKMSGYKESELLNAPHNILRHADMPSVIFTLLWSRIKEKKHINAYVKNRTKNGDFYWVFANVTASLDSKNNTIGYYSVRRKPSDRALQVIESLYIKLTQAEARSGVAASSKLLEETLLSEGVSYDEFIINLQK